MSKPASRTAALVVATLALLTAGAGVAKAQTPKPATADAAAAAATDADADADADASDGDADADAPEGEALAEEAAAPVAPSASTPPAESASAAPSASAPAPAAPAASAGSGTPASVQLGDAAVFTVAVGHGGQSAKARADAATATLKQAAGSVKPDEVRVEDRADSAAIYAGKTPIIELYPDDATAAGDSSLKDHAARVAAQIREAIRREQKRSAIANTVFSLSLVVLAALFAIYLLRKLGEFTDRARDFIVKNPDRIPTLRLYSLEVVRPAALRSALVVGFGALRFIGQISIGYFWLLGSLSLFETTRPYTEKLTGLVVSPITGLIGRAVATIPMLVVTAIAAVAVLVVLRFVAMFFSSVARGETRVAWLSAELATPTSMLLRIGIVAAVLVFAAPVVTGDEQGALSRVGTVVIAALGLAATPLLATALAGAAVLYSRRLSPGDVTRIGAQGGRVKSIGLVDVQIETEDGSTVRVPHLLFLFKTSKLSSKTAGLELDVLVAASEKPTVVRQVLLTAATRFDAAPHVELVAADADGLRFRVRLVAASPDTTRGDALSALVEALAERGIPLGRGRAAGAA